MIGILIKDNILGHVGFNKLLSDVMNMRGIIVSHRWSKSETQHIELQIDKSYPREIKVQKHADQRIKELIKKYETMSFYDFKEYAMKYYGEIRI